MKLIYYCLTILFVVSNMACTNPFSSKEKFASDQERLFYYIKNNDVNKIKRIINEVDLNKPAPGYSVSFIRW